MRFALAAACLIAGWSAMPVAFAGLTEDFHQAQEKLGEVLLDSYAGDRAPGQFAVVEQGLNTLSQYLKSPEGRTMADRRTEGTLAQQIGIQRALLQHVAALEMLQAQRAGDLSTAQNWRALISLPKFASEQDSTLLLQTNDLASASSPEVSRALAREYLLWQVMRIRQILDFLHQKAVRGVATADSVAAYVAEAVALAQFPPKLLETAGLSSATTPVARLDWKADLTPKEQATLITDWREKLEASLPNLFTDSDISRMQRLLARLLKIVPREYENGVADGKITIDFEYREAVAFTDKAQSIVNQLAPVWKQEQTEAYGKYHGEITGLLEKLAAAIPNLVPLEEIQSLASQTNTILEREFHISARRPGDKGDVIEETALEVRASLGSSLAAVQAGQWEVAESLRLDAYTAFDTEIEPRVLPRNPDLGRKAERSFLDGDENAPGIKLVIDRRLPMDEIQAAYERTLGMVEQSVDILKVAVSPTTIAVTAFGIVAREGLEAVVILTALLAGLRGPENRSTRKGISQGAWLAVAATALTFWLSRTIVTSLTQFGEKLEAIVSILAVIILLIVTNWVFHKFYWAGWNSKLRALSKSATGATHRWEWLALVGVGFLTIYREGFETALFMQSLLLEGNIHAVIIGGVAGFGLIAAVGLLTFRFGVKLPYRKLLIVTGLLVVSIMVTFSGSTVRLFQTVGWLPIDPIPHVQIPNWVSLWFGLYPSWQGVLIPLAMLGYVGGAWLLTRWLSARARANETPVPVASLTRKPSIHS
jgi:high-affinity iron transporter